MTEEKTPLKWKFENETIVTSPAVSDGVVYFGSHDDHLYAVDIKTGKEKWKFESGDSIYYTPVVSDGVVYFGSKDKHLYALDTKTGEERWKFETGSYVNSTPAVIDGTVILAVRGVSVSFNIQ
jgi:outer membrane protein assembly factor BamB|tara:strand:- start:420 stop:788 length:369 start_codon:yes stop_codon:yes gene_type:complete